VEVVAQPEVVVAAVAQEQAEAAVVQEQAEAVAHLEFPAVDMQQHQLLRKERELVRKRSQLHLPNYHILPDKL
jgi:hypothetical protein